MSLTLRQSSILKKIFNSPITIRQATIESVITGAAGQAVLVISGILVARVLGVEGRGYLAILVLFPALISQIGLLGLPIAATYYIAYNRGDASDIFNTLRIPILFQIFLLPIIHFCVLSFYLTDKPKEIQLAGYFTLLAIPGIMTQRYGLALLQGLKIFRSFNVMRLMPAAIYSVGILLIFWTGIGNLPTITLAWVFTNLTIGILTFYYACKRLNIRKKYKNNQANKNFQKMLKFGIKGFLGEISPMENFRLDQLVAGLILSPAALGLYVVAQAFTNLPRFIAQSISLIVYPTIGSKTDHKSSKRFLSRFLLITLISNSLIVLMLIVIMPFLIPFLFGYTFSDSIPIARILLIGAFFVSLKRVIVEGFRGMGKPEISTWSELSVYPVFVILIFVLVSFFELTGLAITVTMSYFLSLIISTKFYLKLQ